MPRPCNEPLVDENDYVIAYCRQPWGTEHSHSDMPVGEMVWADLAAYVNCPECTEPLVNDACPACSWPHL